MTRTLYVRADVGIRPYAPSTEGVCIIPTAACTPRVLVPLRFTARSRRPTHRLSWSRALFSVIPRSTPRVLASRREATWESVSQFLCPRRSLFCLCSSFCCRFYSEMQSRIVLYFNAKALLNGGQRPPPTFAAKRQRRDLIIAKPRGEVSKGEGSQPSLFGRFKEGGFSRGKGNRNPFPLEWRSLDTFFRQGKKVSRRRQKYKCLGRTESSAPTPAY